MPSVPAVVKYRGEPVVKLVAGEDGEVSATEVIGEAGGRVVNWLVTPRSFYFPEGMQEGDAFIGPAFLQRFLMTVHLLGKEFTAEVDFSALAKLPPPPSQVQHWKEHMRREED